MRDSLLQGNIVERILWDAAGRPARVTLYVYERAGRYKARVIGVSYLEALGGRADKTELALCGKTCGDPAAADTAERCDPIASPYFDSNLLYVSGSKPRAPSA